MGVCACVKLMQVSFVKLKIGNTRSAHMIMHIMVF